MNRLSRTSGWSHETPTMAEVGDIIHTQVEFAYASISRWEQMNATCIGIFQHMTGLLMNTAGNIVSIFKEEDDDGKIARTSDRDFVYNSFPAIIYLREGERGEAEAICSTVNDFVEYLGYTKTREDDLVRGSWFKRMYYKIKETVDREEVYDRAKIAEDILFGHASIDVDVKIVDMVTKLVQIFGQVQFVCRGGCGIIFVP